MFAKNIRNKKHKWSSLPFLFHNISCDSFRYFNYLQMN